MQGKYSLAGYEDFRSDLLAEVRREAFGEDIGQFSWITAEEYRRFLTLLQVGPDTVLVDVACGSGGLSLCAATETKCQVIGLDLSEEAIATATKTGQELGLRDRVRFFVQDAREPLALDAESADAIISIDAINHIFDRAKLLAEWKRVLRPGGRFLFTDAVVVGDRLSRDEIIARSSRMGEFIFTPAGAHEQMIKNSGFVDVSSEDVTSTIALTAQRWHDARARRREALTQIEGEEQFEDMQQMLSTAALLARERRLLRIAYSGRKPTSS